MRPEHDLFISYKSEDANLVRAVVECLIAHGLKVWFAEYAVRLRDYNEDKRKHGADFPTVRAMIDEAIDNSRFFLAFTNQAWVASRFCQQESRRILALPGSEAKVAQVCVRHGMGDAPVPAWGRSLTIDYPSSRPKDGNNPLRVKEMIDFVNELSWFDRPLQATPVQIEGESLNLRFGVQLRPGPFKEEVPWRTFRAGSDFPGEHYQYEGQIGGCAANLVAAINPYHTTFDDMPDLDRDRDNDHLVYDSYKEVAEKWLSHTGGDERGAHIVFRENRREFALTSAMSQPSGDCIWERRYTVSLADDKGHVTGGLALVFNVTLPANDDASLQAFCRMTPVFDAIVYSIPAYRPHSSLFAPEHLQIVLAKLGLVMALGYLYVSTQSGSLFPLLSPRGSIGIVRGFAAAVIGGIVMDFVMALLSKGSRRLASAFSLSVSPNLTTSVFLPTLFPRHWRLLHNMWNMIVGSLGLLVRALLLGLVKGWLVIVILALPAILGRMTSALYWSLLGAWIYLLGIKTLNEYIPVKGGKKSLFVGPEKMRSE